MEKPAYPIYASKNGISGVVRFRYDVDAQGKVSQMRITQSSPDHLFDDAVIRAVAKWRFEQNKPAKNLSMTVYMKAAKPALVVAP
ncbi:energy transducer TonB [Pseudescherichia sp.]|uniref:energy transducer TonB n=1 Tax=Pseudescherichia sp. TaxID=2055881 RepID=UPI0028973A2E|nr:energy transducer TonB [Pseudescherichia sp.]